MTSWENLGENRDIPTNIYVVLLFQNNVTAARKKTRKKQQQQHTICTFTLAEIMLISGHISITSNSKVNEVFILAGQWQQFNFTWRGLCAHEPNRNDRFMKNVIFLKPTYPWDGGTMSFLLPPTCIPIQTEKKNTWIPYPCNKESRKLREVATQN